MTQTERRVSIKKLRPGFIDDEIKGCFAMDGKLVVRPDYQRAFVYSDKQRNLVIDTVQKGMPLGIMYWMKKPKTDDTGNSILDKDGNLDYYYELMDGQQRTLSLLQYCAGEYSIDYRYFYNLSPTEQAQILDYELLVYVCEGTDEERREWFQRINVAGAVLTDQEILNSIYSGPWCQDAKKYFSKIGGPAAAIGDKYLSGKVNRQEYLETALKWICDRDGIDIPEYMALHQNDPTAVELWSYFRSVIDWVKALFPVYRSKPMKSVAWGLFYNRFKDVKFDPAALEQRIKELILDDEIVKNETGIYEYVLSGDEKYLHFRAFSDSDKLRKYEEQNHICFHCKKEFDYKRMHGDHIIPWSQGGKTTYENLAMLCSKCNLEKSDK